MKFLIDECLTAALANIAIERGYYDSAHLIHRGMRRWGDSKIAKTAIIDSWTLVTCNANDFRPKPGSNSKAPCYVGVELHAGLICLNLPKNADKKVQKTYFEEALNELEDVSELTNEIIEISPDPDDPEKLDVNRYDFPE